MYNSFGSVLYSWVCIIFTCI